MRIKTTGRNREKVSTSGRGIVPSNNPSPSPSSHLPLSSPHHLMLAPYLSSETFHLFYLRFVSLCLPNTHTHKNTHVFSPHVGSLYSPPSPVACHGCHFIAPTHLLHATIWEEKKNSVPHLNRYREPLSQYT